MKISKIVTLSLVFIGAFGLLKFAFSFMGAINQYGEVHALRQRLIERKSDKYKDVEI